MIRVGRDWYKRAADMRADDAARWYQLWNHAVPTGIVSVIDEQTERPAIDYGRQGKVVRVVPP